MSAGLERLVSQRIEAAGFDDGHPPDVPDHVTELELETPEEAPARAGRPVLAGLLIILAVAWFAASGLALWRTAPALQLVELLSWIATISVPPALLALLWLLFGRTGRLETERFTEAVAAMRSEAESLDRVLGIVAERLAANRSQLSEDAARLMKLGEEAADRLGRVTHYLAREGAELDRRGQALENAAGQARVDFGVLLADLPNAEAAARAFSDTLREAGMSAHERARALEAQLSAIAARAQEADSTTGGAAERLGAHISRIESSAGVASQRLEEAAARVDAAVDGALGRTGEAIETTRSALDVQAQALLAAIEEGRARFLDAGAEASRSLAARLGEAGAQVDSLASRVAAQDEASRRLVASLAAEIEALEARLAALGERGEAQSAQMATALAGLRDATATVRQEVDASTTEAVALVGRTQELAGSLEGVTAQLRGDLPAALTAIEAQAGATREAALGAVEPVAAARDAAAEAARQLADTEAAIERQRSALDALIARVTEGAGTVEEKLAALRVAATGADETAATLVRETGPELVEALVRVREAARVAASHARDAITQVIPDGAAAYAEGVRQAVETAVADSLKQQLGEIEAVSQRAVNAARTASERLTRQLLTLGEGAAALEDRIEQERALREEQERGSLSRRVALLIESLNSTAIDVTKILSNEVTDSAWTAYLKGDRGVFTRRAVRLLDSGEAREIARHYDEEPEFREQVNRYVHDFEAMLRRVLADREGDALSITLLSSDMGKLYVALAQAIERLRR
jgi:hypothetical protein